MPHFIIDCSEDIVGKLSPDEIMQAVYETADATGLFAKNDIKVRLNPYKYFKLGDGKTSFIHVFSYIMEGRSVDQKVDLLKKIIQKLNQMFPDVSILSMNVKEFELATYSNKSLINPNNTIGDRFF